MRKQPPSDETISAGFFHPTVIDRHGYEQPGNRAFGAGTADGEWWVKCPYGETGGTLWAREAWRTLAVWDSLPPRGLPVPQAKPLRYEADGAVNCGTWDVKFGRLRPGMFMLRELSRITIEVTGIRVERLQEITEADAKAEGIILLGNMKDGDGYGVQEGDRNLTDTAREAYRHLWDSINGKGSWAANPWVWVVEFNGGAR